MTDCPRGRDCFVAPRAPRNDDVGRRFKWREALSIGLPRGILEPGDTEPLNRRGIPGLFLKAEMNPLGFRF